MTHIFRDKAVFITGHTGFKGIWLSLLLKEFGARVYGYALPPVNNPIYEDTCSDLFEQSWYADIRDGAKLKAAIATAQPDIIFHLAAQPLVIESYRDPVYTFDVNIIGTALLLDALRDYSKSCAVILITTDKVYHNNEWVYPYREVDQLGGYDPYSASKACAEMIAASYRQSFFSTAKLAQNGIAVATVRAGNVIGGGDWSDNRIIPDIIRAFHKGMVLEVRNPMAVRPWQHVLDALYGYLVLAEKLLTDGTNPAWSSAWNFGPFAADNLLVKEIVEMAASAWGGGDYQLKGNETGDLHEAGLLRLDCSKAQQQLNWKPVWDASVAVNKAVAWYKEVLTGQQKPAAATLSQIHTFLSEAGI